MEVDGHAEVTASLPEQADIAADASLEKALDPHTGTNFALQAPSMLIGVFLSSVREPVQLKILPSLMRRLKMC